MHALARMRGLRTLKLADNRFGGEIPTQIGSLHGLEMLDLYNNRFSGDIPPTVRHLHELRFLYIDKEHLLPLRKRYCGQRLPDLGKYSYIIIRDEYDKMMATHCPDDELYDTAFTFSALQDSGVYEM